jgi:eukaryotic-like serine/threonine-protein kinase
VSDGEREKPRSIGRYVLFEEVAHGGMATVHLGRLRGPAGFARTVAIKRLHPPFARDPEFVSMFLDEARLAARIQHPNVVSVLDVVAAEGELFLVMDYIHGESLGQLIRLAGKQGRGIPRRVLVSIMIGVLTGLDAAHEARNERGDRLEIVHRDVSPQNVLLGVDGVPRILDFGVAKAALRVHWSADAGQVKGKLGYMAPEQFTTGLVDRRTDVYAVGVMLWEGLTGRRLHDPRVAKDSGMIMARILSGEIDPPSKLVPSTPKELDAIVQKALSRSSSERYPTAGEMAAALEEVVPMAPARQIGEWVRGVAGEMLEVRASKVNEIESAELPVRTSSSSDYAILSDGDRRDSIRRGAEGSAPPARSSRDASTQPPRHLLASGLDLASLKPRPAPSFDEVPPWESMVPPAELEDGAASAVREIAAPTAEPTPKSSIDEAAAPVAKAVGEAAVKVEAAAPAAKSVGDASKPGERPPAPPVRASPPTAASPRSAGAPLPPPPPRPGGDKPPPPSVAKPKGPPIPPARTAAMMPSPIASGGGGAIPPPIPAGGEGTNAPARPGVQTIVGAPARPGVQTIVGTPALPGVQAIVGTPARPGVQTIVGTPALPISPRDAALAALPVLMDPAEETDSGHKAPFLVTPIPPPAVPHAAPVSGPSHVGPVSKPGTPLQTPMGLGPAPAAGAIQPSGTTYASAPETPVDASPSVPPLPGSLPLTAPKRLVWASGAALSFLVLIVAWAVWPRSANGNKDTGVTTVPTSAATTGATSASQPAVPLPSSIPPVPETPKAEATEATAAPPPTEPTPAPPPPVAQTSIPAAPHPRSGSHAPARSNCNPPYTVDSQGVRIPKRECFR